MLNVNIGVRVYFHFNDSLGGKWVRSCV